MARRDRRNEDRYSRDEDWRRRSGTRSEAYENDPYGVGSAGDYGRSDREYGSSYGRGRDDWSSGNDYGRSRGYGGDRDSEVGGKSRSAGQREYGYGQSRYNEPFRSSSYGRDYSGYGDWNRGGSELGYGGDRWDSFRNSDSENRRDRDHNRRNWLGSDDKRGYGNEERSFWHKASDEVSSWFGDEEAERRRRQDQRGRGPRNYTRSGDRIREDVNDRLTDDWRVDASEIEVIVSGTEVTLSGSVASRDQRRRAEDIAESVSGVTHVQNNLRVKDRDQSWSGSRTSPNQGTSGVSSSGTGGTASGSTPTAIGTTK
jgi:osmotically-inducible protein OsmY